jgi:hypothetical protein
VSNEKEISHGRVLWQIYLRSFDQGRLTMPTGLAGSEVPINLSPIRLLFGKKLRLNSKRTRIAYRKTSCWPSQDAVTVESFPASIVTCLVALLIGFSADA